MSDNHIIEVEILNRSYKVKCPPSQIQELKLAAQYVDQQMRKIRQASSTSSPDRVAVVCALNICYELMELKQQKNQYIDVMNQRIQALQERIEQSLDDLTKEEEPA